MRPPRDPVSSGMMAAHLLPLGLLLAYGGVFATAALGWSLIGFDDHPGQLYRVWHVLALGPAPWAWNPGWWAGYPELQFYPPGVAYTVALLHVGSGGLVSVTGAYQALVWIAYLAPGAAVWLLLRRTLGDGWLALPGAFVASTLSAGLASGVEGGVHTGMVPARLGWALLPIVALSLTRFMRGGGVPWPTALLVAVVVLVHPSHAPAAVVLVALAALARGDRRALAGAMGVLALAAGLTAFWTLPLLARIEHTRALAWGTFSLRETFGYPLAAILVGLAVLGAWPHAGSRGRPALSRLLTLAPWAMAAVLSVDAFLLEPLGMRWLPADRVADSVWLAFVISAGVTVGRLVGALAGPEARPRAALSIVAVGLAVLAMLPAGTATLWPRGAGWERYETIDRGLRLRALWSALREAPAGRVLFVRSGVPLVYGDAWWRAHSHVTALTPLHAGRDIVNGTFTHPSPVAAFVYRGDAGRAPIRELVERLDGRRLFGRNLEDLDAETLHRYAERLGVGVVVALDEDVPRLRALAETPWFAPARPSPPFVLYDRRAAPAPLPRDGGPGRLRLDAGAGGDGWIPGRMAYYPLWRATSAGRPLATRRGVLGDLEIEAPDAGAPIELAYERGRVETAGLLVTAGSAVVLGSAWTTALWRRRRAAVRAPACA
jgi:hypothetical protein